MKYTATAVDVSKACEDKIYDLVLLRSLAGSNVSIREIVRSLCFPRPYIISALNTLKISGKIVEIPD